MKRILYRYYQDRSPLFIIQSFQSQIHLYTPKIQGFIEVSHALTKQQTLDQIPTLYITANAFSIHLTRDPDRSHTRGNDAYHSFIGTAGQHHDPVGLEHVLL